MRKAIPFFISQAVTLFGPLADVMSLRVLMAASNAALLLCLPLAAGLCARH